MPSDDDPPPPRAPLGSNTVGEVRDRSAGTIHGAGEVHIGDRHYYAPAPAAPASAPPSDLLPPPGAASSSTSPPLLVPTCRSRGDRGPGRV